MASDNPTAAGGSSRRPRTPPTLDLKAEEVRTEAASEPATPAPAEGAESSISGDAATSDTSPPNPAAPDAGTGTVDVAEAPAVADATTSESGGIAPESAASAATPEPAATEAAPPQAPRRGGAGTVFAALVLGALAGAAAGGGAFYYLAQQAPKAAPVDLGPLNVRLAALEARPVADPAAVTALRQAMGQADARFTALDSALSELKAAPASAPATAPNLDAVKAALAKTESAVADVAARVASLKTAQDGLKSGQDTLKTGQDALKSAQDGLQTALSSAASAAQQAQGQVQQLSPRMDSLSAHIEAVRKEAADAAGAAAAINRGAASVLVLGTLKQSIDAGRPFAPELDAARSLLGPRAAPLEPFAAMAQAGFPPLPKLADQLAAAGDAAVDGLTPAPEAPPADSSLVTRFLASAQSLVKVRPADGVDPDSLRGIVRRAVGDVRAGDLDSALATLKQLPPPVQQKLAGVVGELDARRRAAEAAATLYQQALAAITGKVP